MLDRARRTRPPSHPGRIIRAHYLGPLRLTVTALAEHRGISRKTLSKVVNERGSVTAAMAQRLGRAFNTGPELWLNLQLARDLWDSGHATGDWQNIKPLPGLPAVAEHAES
jgi:addiction module HigA family antidote